MIMVTWQSSEVVIINFLAYIMPNFVIWNFMVRLLFKYLYQVSTLQNKYVLAKFFSFQILFNQNLQKINPYYWKVKKYAVVYL